jgi:hypothetical protein
MYGVLNDEPATDDSLGRRVLARAFADLAGRCETPLVVSVYGTWGSGKTTFLRLVETEFDANRCRAVWFNAWQHDQDAAPAVSLLHAMVDALGLGRELRNAITQVAMAFGSVILQKTTTLTLDNLQKVQSLVDDENFRVRDARSKLRTYFADAVARARGAGNDRIVFFVDDLDRCAPDTVLRFLEAIKLYFNLDGCVFFLGLDRESIESALERSGTHLGGAEAAYLDKLIQLPFTLPPLAESTFKGYLARITPAELSSCLPLMLAGLERNPRSAKRFLNDLVLRHQLALALELHAYDPRLLALLLLFEYLQPALFKRLATTPKLLAELRADRTLATSEITAPRLLAALFAGYVPQYASLASYVGLTDLDIEPSTVARPRAPDVEQVLAQHRTWLRTSGREGQRASLHGAQLAGRSFAGALLRAARLEATRLEGVDLGGADLRRAVLAGARMAGADLGGANLRFADLREADLHGATLRHADLRGADLRGTNLRGADLLHAIGLTGEQIEESLVDAKTRLPLPLSMPFKAGVA